MGSAVFSNGGPLHEKVLKKTDIEVIYLSRLIHCLLRICLHFVTGVVGNLGDRLLKDGRRLSDWKRRIQVRLTL